MSLSKNLERWIFASFAQHFKNQQSSIPLYIEKLDKNYRSSDKDWAEFRLDGPYYRFPSKTTTIIELEVNVYISSLMDSGDIYRLDSNIGVFRSAFTPEISIYRYGDGPEDDQQLWGCFRLSPIVSGDRELRVTRLGQVEPRTRMENAVIEGHYECTV